jgi:heme-degrading monooxygenase HmoA
VIGRLTTSQTTPDKLDEVIRTFTEEDIPAAKNQRGFRGCYLFTDANTGKFFSISFWDSKGDIANDEKSGQYQKRVGFRKHLYLTPPVREIFEVSAKHQVNP